MQPLSAQKKERNSNLEAYRIIVMLLIVAHHYLVNSGLLSVVLEDPFTKRGIFALLVGAWGKTGINCFVLITGYYMCCSKVTVSKALKLFFQTEFYNLIISVIFSIKSGAFAWKPVIWSIFFMDKESGRFMNCYLLFFLLIPFLNYLVNILDHKKHLLLMLVLLFIYTIRGTIPYMRISTNYISWFIVVFFIGAYLRLYSDNLPQWLRKPLPSFLCLCVLFGISVASIPAFLVLKQYASWLDQYYLISDSYKILAVLLSVVAFLFVISLKPKRIKLINVIGSITYGVLLIHANSDAMRAWLWGETLQPVNAYAHRWFYLHYILSVVGIFVICGLLDMIRLYLIEKPLFKLFSKQIAKLDENMNNLLY